MVTVLGTIGVVSTTSSVAQRRRAELAIRQALGSTPRDGLLLLSRQTLARLMLGIAGSTVLTWALLRLRSRAFPELLPDGAALSSAGSPSVLALFVGSVLLVLGLGALAALIPVHRTMRTPVNELLGPR